MSTAQSDTPYGVNFVITFDDVTNLISAQRTAAWADIARRIAHEIKNPLTPIQLSAERLQSKYGRKQALNILNRVRQCENDDPVTDFNFSAAAWCN